MPQFLTIDLGTTLFKFAIFDDRGSMLSLTRVKPPIDHPVPGQWEITVARFREAVAQGIGQLGKQIPLDDVCAISFASQANTITLLDGKDGALTPLVLWPDERAVDYEDEIRRAADGPDFRRQTGIPALGHQFAAAKLLRWRRENTEIWRHAPRLFFISDLLTWIFTRRHIIEAGIAGLSGAADIRALHWREQALASLGMDALILPTIARAGSDLGVIDPQAAKEFRLPRNCHFVVGCLDQYAGAIGTGVVTPGSVSETTGTVLAAVRCTHAFRDNVPGDVFVGPSFDPNLFFEMSFSSTSANLLEHYRNSLPDRPSFPELTALAEQSVSGDLIIEAYDPGKPIDYCFRNVTAHHSRGQIVRAILECVARQCASQIRSLCGNDLPARVASAGGGARSPLWLRIKSQTLGAAFAATACEEPTSLGAAMLAARAMSGKSLADLAKQWVRPA